MQESWSNREETLSLCFLYVSVAPGYSSQPGEVFFSLGCQDSVTSMMWHYREPRALTKLSILPVPFSFTSEADAPVDIQVTTTSYCHTVTLPCFRSSIPRSGVLWTTGTKTTGCFRWWKSSDSRKPHPLRSSSLV